LFLVTKVYFVSIYKKAQIKNQIEMRISKSLVLLCLVLVGVAAADDEAAAPAVEADARAKLLVSKQVSSKLTLSEKPIRVYP
jgi:hypothetical protein